MFSLKQTKKFKNIDEYPLVGTGGWRENLKKTKFYFKIVNFVLTYYRNTIRLPVTMTGMRCSVVGE